MIKTFDVAIIGAGAAGCFAALKIAKENKNTKTIIFDLGRPPGKRRRQLEGWFGVFPNSDGKFYLHDQAVVQMTSGARKVKTAANYVNNYISSLINVKTIKDREVYVGLEKRFKKNNFSYHANDIIQFYPKDIHAMSKDIATVLEQSGSVQFSFDNEVHKIHKQRGQFCISTAEGEFFAKNIIMAVGRSGWRWVAGVYRDFGIIENNDTATYGVYAEISSSYMKDFNKANLSFYKEGLEVGPLQWNGTIVPEDHVDVAIASFRSNENRWKTDKVSFLITGHRHFENKGFEQTDRLGKLAFLLANDRISKERVSTLMNKKSKISVITEYDWLLGASQDIATIIPDFLSKGYFHIPAIKPMPPKIKIGNNFSTEIDNFYVVGESAGIVGLYGAALTGTIAADNFKK